MMKITRLQMKNHVLFGDVDIRLNDDIISIVGVNGSGKSFLINCFHPYSSDNRYFRSYAFKPQNTGYKRVEYEEDNGDMYIVEHEYVPKGSTHSCKSYLTLIKSTGEEIKLNPTGHNELFKEMVQRYLHFNSNVYDVSLISFESRGLTGSSAQTRKQVLESTIDLDILKKLKDNSQDLSKKYKNWSDLVFKNRAVYLNDGRGESSLREKIKSLHINLIENTKKNKLYREKLIRLNSEKAKVEELNKCDYKDDLRVLNNVYKTGMFDTPLIKVLERKKQKLNELESLADRRLTIKSKLDDLALIEQKKEVLKELKNDVDSYNKRIEDIRAFITSHINLKDNESLDLSLLDSYKDLSTFLYIYISPLDKGYDSLSEVNFQMCELENIISKGEDLISEFNTCKSVCGDNKFEIPESTSCKNCDLFKVYGSAQKFMERHKEDVEAYVKGKEDYSENLARLKNLTRNLPNNTNMINSLVPLIKDKFDDNEIDNVSKVLKLGGDRNKINRITLLHQDLVQAYKEEQSNINLRKETEYKIKTIELEISNSDLNSNTVEIKKELEDITAQINRINQDPVFQLDNILNTIPNSFMSRIDSNDMKLIALASREINDVKTEYELVFNNQSVFERLTRELNTIDIELSSIESVIESIKRDLHNSEKDLSDFLDLDSKLKRYTHIKDSILKCRDIITKEIPIILMRNNLDFIERIVNTILEENDIDISIKMVPDDKEVRIEAFVRTDTELADVSQLSSGEKCLVSLLLNAAVVHLLGYNVLRLDEIDANLSVNNRSKFLSIIYSIMNVLNISQVISISHSITSGITENRKIVLGDPSELDVAISDNDILIQRNIN